MPSLNQESRVWPRESRCLIATKRYRRSSNNTLPRLRATLIPTLFQLEKWMKLTLSHSSIQRSPPFAVVNVSPRHATRSSSLNPSIPCILPVPLSSILTISREQIVRLTRRIPPNHHRTRKSVAILTTFCWCLPLKWGREIPMTPQRSRPEPFPNRVKTTRLSYNSLSLYFPKSPSLLKPINHCKYLSASFW